MSSAFSSNGLPTYKLIFNAGNEIHAAVSAFLQAAPSSTTDPVLANQLQDYYVGHSRIIRRCSDKCTDLNISKISFVKSLDPNEGAYSNVTRPHWPQYLQVNGTGFSVLEVNQTSIGVRPDSDASARCDFFHSQSYVVRN